MREVWLRCPHCHWEWRAAVLTDEPPWQGVTPADLAQHGCNRCKCDQPMQIVEPHEER